MPGLDLTQVLTNPRFADHVVVARRRQVVNEFGEAVITRRLIPDVVAVVTMAGGNSLARGADQQSQPRTLSVVTPFALRGPAKDARDREWQPDVVLYGDQEYLVDDLDPYDRYGAGWVQARCSLFVNVGEPVVTTNG